MRAIILMERGESHCQRLGSNQSPSSVSLRLHTAAPGEGDKKERMDNLMWAVHHCPFWHQERNF